MTPDLSCERYQDSLPWYVANSLSDDERVEIERHLASCGRCRAALAEWREVAGTMRRADERIPPDTASLTTWARISRQLGAQVELADKVNERTIMRLKDRILPETHTPVEAFPVARPRGRSHRFMDLIAVVALIALSAGVFSFLATHGKGVTAPHSACAPSQATASLPAHTVLRAITSTEADDSWAVGAIWDLKQPLSTPSGLLLHLRNCHWAPAGTPIPNAYLWDVSMISPDDGWAVGATITLHTIRRPDGTSEFGGYTSQPLALHYTHGAWQVVKMTPDMGASDEKATTGSADAGFIEKVKMVSADEGWMLLEHGKDVISTYNGSILVTSTAWSYSLLHYQNGTWTNVPMGFLKPFTKVRDIDARQPGEVWLAGDYVDVANHATPPFIAHYAAGAWTTYSGETIGADASLQTISEISPTDVWASGNGLYHFDGARWSQTNIQGAAPSGVAPDIQPVIDRIAVLSPTQGWAFAYYATSVTQRARVAVRYDHGVWQWTPLQVRGATPDLLITGFAQSGPSQGWALGSRIVNYEEESSLLYYDAGAWGVVRQQS